MLYFKAFVGCFQFNNAAGSCKVNCSTSGEIVANPYDCYSFFFCLGSGEYSHEPFYCVDGYYFDQEQTQCVEEDPNDPCEPDCV